jgi:hypothetical protein
LLSFAWQNIGYNINAVNEPERLLQKDTRLPYGL